MKNVFLSLTLTGSVIGELVYYDGRPIALPKPDCEVALDVLFLQDTTGSFNDDLPNVAAQIPKMISAIQSNYPNSWFGVAEFRDKPYEPFGLVGQDFCFNLQNPLSPRIDDTLNGYKRLLATGGGDLPEAQYQAIINAFQYQKVGWRPLGSGSGKATGRLVIISTDAAVHFPGENHQAPLPDQAKHKNDGQTRQDDINYQCLNMEYPDPSQVASAVKADNNQYLAILTPDDDTTVTDVWHWINEGLLLQPKSFYQYIKSDSSNFIDKVLQCITAVGDAVCATTTAPPTSTPTTTTLPSTTSTCSTTFTSTTTSTATTTMPATYTTTTTSTATYTSTDTTTTITTPTTTTSTSPTTYTSTATSTSPTTHTSTSTSTTRPTTTTHTTPATATKTDTCPCPCPCPKPCPSPCNCDRCCKDSVMLKVIGHPKKIDMDIEYEKSH